MKKKSLVFFLVSGVLSSCLTNDVFDAKAKFASDTTLISHFISNNNISGTVKLTQGVWYSIDTVGLGVYPVLSDSIKVTYHAKYINSASQSLASLEEVDAKLEPGVTALLSSVISGWQIGLLRFPSGSYGRLFIPSGLAFGVSQQGKIPANASLLYEIKLISSVGTRFPTDTTAVGRYVGLIFDSLRLRKNKVIKDPSGIWYSYDTLISSKLSPTLTSSIDISSYRGHLLNSTTPFLSSSDTTLVLKDQITAFKIILPKMKEGTTVTLYVPSGFGYGSGFSTLPNSNLVYQLTLNRVH